MNKWIKEYGLTKGDWKYWLQIWKTGSFCFPSNVTWKGTVLTLLLKSPTPLTPATHTPMPTRNIWKQSNFLKCHMHSHLIMPLSAKWAEGSHISSCFPKTLKKYRVGGGTISKHSIYIRTPKPFMLKLFSWTYVKDIRKVLSTHFCCWNKRSSVRAGSQSSKTSNTVPER